MYSCKNDIKIMIANRLNTYLQEIKQFNYMNNKDLK